jgi:hypothetical protein
MMYILPRDQAEESGVRSRRQWKTAKEIISMPQGRKDG